MKTNRNYLNAGLVLTALTLLALAFPSMAGDQVPHKGQEVGVVTKGAFQFPFSLQSTAAEGEATHIGHYTLTGDFVVDVRVGTAAGVFTLTAANGDGPGIGELAKVIHTHNPLAFLFGPPQRRQQQTGKDGDYCYNDQEFDEREAGTFKLCPSSFY